MDLNKIQETMATVAVLSGLLREYVLDSDNPSELDGAFIADQARRIQALLETVANAAY